MSISSKVQSLISEAKQRILTNLKLDVDQDLYEEMKSKYENADGTPMMDEDGKEIFGEVIYPKQVQGLEDFIDPVIDELVRSYQPIIKKVDNNRILQWNEARVLEVDANLRNIVIALPPRSVDKMIITIVKIDSGINTVTIQDNQNTIKTLNTQFQSATFCNGSSSWLEI